MSILLVIMFERGMGCLNWEEGIQGGGGQSFNRYCKGWRGLRRSNFGVTVRLVVKRGLRKTLRRGKKTIQTIDVEDG